MSVEIRPLGTWALNPTDTSWSAFNYCIYPSITSLSSAEYLHRSRKNALHSSPLAVYTVCRLSSLVNPHHCPVSILTSALLFHNLSITFHHPLTCHFYTWSQQSLTTAALPVLNSLMPLLPNCSSFSEHCHAESFLSYPLKAFVNHFPRP